MTDSFALELTCLEFSIENETIVRIPELRIKQGDIVGILGPSGCGKTTFLFLLCGLLSAEESSRIRVLDRSVSDCIRDGLISLSFQTPVLMPWRSASSNVALALELKGKKPNPRHLEETLDRVELSRNVQSYFPEQLSSGMLSRVAVAQALASQSKILLMDEVFGTLDEATRVKMDVMLRDINVHEIKATVLFVTHSIDEALLISDRILIFSKLNGSKASNIINDLPVEFRNRRTLKTRYTADFLDQKQRIEKIFFEEALE